MSNRTIRIGDVFGGRFRVRGFHRRGGMGELWEAIDESNGERVAIKVLRAETAREERFEREAAVLSSIDHPGVVRHIANGVAEGGARWIAMEWLVGEDLADRLRRGPLSVAETIALGVAVLRALAVAHARGVVHRDLKPSNIFLPAGAAADAKILDFGLARAENAGRELTRTGAVVGTRGYMAPEQAFGDKRAIGPKADLFAVGCVLYEALAGSAAFEADDSHEVLRRILFDDPRPLAGRAPDVPDALAAILDEALAKEPDERPEGAVAMADALARILDGSLRDGVRLTVVSGADIGLSRFFAELPLDIGKHASATLALRDSAASRFHCAIEREGARIVARDLESKNGLFVDGARASRAVLRDGAVLGVGASKLRVERATEATALPTGAERARTVDANVLLEGNGWDARAFAESLHRTSARRRAPFVAVYGGALRLDDLPTVSGGTLLVEEADALTATAQDALAQYFESRSVPTPRGPAPADVRFVTTAAADLRLAVNAQRFRPDLFFALAGVRLHPRRP